MATKACSKCKVVKPLDDYPGDSRKRDGKASACKPCRYAVQKAWIERGRRPAPSDVPDGMKRCARCGVVKAADRSSFSRRGRGYLRSMCKVCVNAEQAAKRKDPEYVRYMREAQKRSREKHPRDSEKMSMYSLRRRAAKRGLAEGEHELIDRARVYDTDRGICHLCLRAVDPSDWHMDHIIPLSRGGVHLYENVAVSHPVCNRKKRDAIIGSGAYAYDRCSYDV